MGSASSLTPSHRLVRFLFSLSLASCDTKRLICSGESINCYKLTTYFLSFTEANIDKDDLVVKISLNKDFRKNDYGETVFYKDDGEILAAVYPRMGRMIVWNASIPFIFKPPAMTYVQAQFDVIVRLTISKEKADQKITETKVFSDLRKI